MKIQKAILTIMPIFFVSGCTGSLLLGSSAEKELESQPSYFRRHLGPVVTDFTNPAGLFFLGEVKGYCIPGSTDIYGDELHHPMYFYFGANRAVVFHEGFHSFELNVRDYDPDAWNKFYAELSACDPDASYGGMIEELFCIIIPFWMFLPMQGHVMRYGNINHYEDTATIWVWLQSHDLEKSKDPILKCKANAVRKLALGDFSAYKYK